MYQIAIVEDEENEVLNLKSFLQKYGKERGYSYEISVFSNGLSFLTNYKGNYDIIFMDIEMPHLNGMDAAARLREIDPRVCLIFVTNMAQYAIKGYEVNASDFILKPLDYPSFCFKMDKIMSSAVTPQSDNLILNRKSGVVMLPISSIRYVEVLSHKVLYHTVHGDYDDWGSLAQIEEKLTPYHFERCNASFLINLRYVDRIERNTVIIGNDEIAISRGKKAGFIQAIMNYLEEHA